MIFVVVGMESGGEPACLTTGAMPGSLNLICGNADLDGTKRNCALKCRRVSPVDREIWAVVVLQTALLEAIVLHPFQHIDNNGTLEDTVVSRPGNHVAVGDKYLRTVACLRE